MIRNNILSLVCFMTFFLKHNSHNRRIGVQWLNGYDVSVKETDANKYTS
jgi:hypothetical protein